MEPHRWRREVTFGSYHAVEVFGNGVRKFQSTDDYEPSRVFQLVGLLGNPLDAREYSKEYLPKHDDRTLSMVKVGGVDLVRVSYPDEANGGVTFKGAAFYFEVNGRLLMTSAQGISYEYSSYVALASKIVPRLIEESAGSRKLLTAVILVEAAPKITDAAFDLPGERSEPGMALNARCDRGPEGELPGVTWSGQGGGPPVNGIVFLSMVDHHGYVRESKLIAGAFLDNARELISIYHKAKFKRPAEIDGSPCETMLIGHIR
jgi:hypothetical protein